MEIWKDIPGYEGLYQVSNTGLIKTLSKTVHFNGNCRQQSEKIMSVEKMKKGYLRAHLSNKGQTKKVMVHRIVYHAFNGEIPIGLTINHKDRNKANNHIDNLELVTNRENTHHFRKSIKRGLPLGVSKNRSKFKAVINVSKKSYHLGSFETPQEAREVYLKALSNLSNAL